ncbi:TPA: hypothetical protein RQN03_000319 [Aeromonas dhakensis]|uniref:hypothetical protein n=1 Tax=Aeromonas dhakensis TaxID=196024 RepID=UPI00288C797A|nr:hypothetical protein [Aeromonas dhakensis]
MFAMTYTMSKSKNIILYISIYIGMFDLTVFNTANSIGQLLTFSILFLFFYKDSVPIFYKAIVIWFVFIIYSNVMALYHGESVYHYVFVMIKTFFIFANAMIIANLLLKYNVSSLYIFISFVFLIQAASLALYSVDAWQDFRNFFLSARASHLEENFGNSFWYRDATLSNQGYSGYALGIIPLVMIGIHKILDSKVMSFEYWLAVISCALGVAVAMVNGRSVFLIIPLYVLYLVLKPKKIVTLYRGAPLILLIISVITFVMLFFEIPSHFVLAMFEQKDNAGGFDSVNDLLTNHIKLKFDVTFLGLGQYMTANGAYVKSDIGYYRQVGVGGLCLIVIYMLSSYLSIRYFADRIFSFFCLLMLLLVNFKQEAFNNTMLIYGVFILIAFEAQTQKRLLKI